MKKKSEKSSSKLNLQDGELRKLIRNKEPLTPETLRKFPGHENLSDAEAEEIIFSLRAFSALVFDYVKELQNTPPELFQARKEKILGLNKPNVIKADKKKKTQERKIANQPLPPQKESNSDFDFFSYQKALMEEIEWQINNR